MYWPLYVINEQQGSTIREVWDGVNLKLTFRRTVSEQVMNLWWELVGLLDSIILSSEDDTIIWTYNSLLGKYTV
jgi:hypothetical protein